MAFDSFALQLIVAELRETIVGGQIRHIEQINATDLILKIQTAQEIAYLLLSAHPVHARAHLVPRPERGKGRSHFADFLMKHLMRGTVTHVAQLDLDRVLHIDVQPMGLLEPTVKRLTGEFMGKHSNLILVDVATGQILESIKHVDDTMSRRRQVLPGLTYESPPRFPKVSPWELTYERFSLLFEEHPDERPDRVILRCVDGFSPAIAREVLLRTEPDPTIEDLWEAFQSVLEDLGTPYVFLQGGHPVTVAPLRLHLPDTELRSFERMSEALHFYHRIAIEREQEAAQQQALQQAIQRRINALRAKISELEMQWSHAENADQFRIYGELLYANLHRLRRGQTEIEVENYYDPELRPVRIALDPALLPTDNAQQYFRRYTKAKRARSVLANLISEQQAQLKRLEHYRQQIEIAADLPSLLTLRQEFIKQGVLSDPQRSRKKKLPEETGFRRYKSVNGYSIYVGRNPKENDLLTLKVANKDDMWLHAKQIPGAHVVIRNPERKEQIPMPTLLQAARIAAFFSQAGKSENVPVDYTWVRYVTKPKGTPPGYVHYTREKTLYVDPERPRSRASTETK